MGNDLDRPQYSGAEAPAGLVNGGLNRQLQPITWVLASDDTLRRKIGRDDVSSPADRHAVFDERARLVFARPAGG